VEKPAQPVKEESNDDMVDAIIIALMLVAVFLIIVVVSVCIMKGKGGASPSTESPGKIELQPVESAAAFKPAGEV